MTTAKFETVSIFELRSAGLQPDTSPLRPVILVVDDEKVIADTLVTILDQAGFAASAAYDGESAIEMASIVPPNLVLSDIVMPGMNGVDLAQAVRQAIPDCRVILFSGQASTVDYLGETPKSPKKLDILAKPLAPRDLIATISRMLRGSN